jgi:hypothetical protein
MTVNPFVELFRSPVATLTAAAYACLLLAGLVVTWWAAARNLVVLDDRWQDGWQLLVPLGYAVRLAAMAAILAIDLLLLAGIIYVLT